MIARVAVLACSLLAHGPLAFGQLTVDALFDKHRLHDVRISMASGDWARLRANFQDNTYYDAALTIDGETVRDAAIRSRGSGTRNGVKPGLRVDFNRNVEKQTFRGLKSLVLDNVYHDASFIREQLAFSVFSEVGIRVPREAFARLTVNGEYWGLYSIVEPIDKTFVSTHIDGGEGNLFEYNVPAVAVPGQLQAWDFALSRGNKTGDYIPVPFEPKTNEREVNGEALLAFLRTISEASDATFAAEISEFIDPQALLTYYAVEVATAEVDGLTSPFGVNNFYLYQPRGTRRFVFIPWDHDFNFTSSSHPIFYGAGRNRLIQRLLADATWNSFYRQTLESIVARFVNAGWMAPQIDSLVALIRESVLEDRKRQGGDDPAAAAQRFEDAVVHIRRVIEGRAASVAAQLKPAARRRSVSP